MILDSSVALLIALGIGAVLFFVVGPTLRGLYKEYSGFREHRRQERLTTERLEEERMNAQIWAPPREHARITG